MITTHYNEITYWLASENDIIWLGLEFKTTWVGLENNHSLGKKKRSIMNFYPSHAVALSNTRGRIFFKCNY